MDAKINKSLEQLNPTSQGNLTLAKTETRNAVEQLDALNAPAIARPNWHEVIDIARHCPSPHNVQPWKIELLDQGIAKLYIDGTRTFPWTDHSGSFIVSSMSMFLACLEFSAHNRGLAIDIEYGDIANLQLRDALSHFATLQLRPLEEADASRFATVYSDQELLNRKTSRKENLHKPIAEEAINRISELTRNFGYEFHLTQDQVTINKVLACDIKALFSDLNHQQYFGELKPYIKLGQKESTFDGLHFDAMNLHKFQLALMKHLPVLLKTPIFSGLAAAIYRKQLGHCQSLAFVCGDFWDREGALVSGQMLIRMWLELSKMDLRVHPFGNLITNQEARKNIEELVGIKNVWFVFRMGYTDEPVKSNRLPLDQILINNQK